MISTRGRYALRMMLDLAEYQGDGYVPLKDVARRQEISKKYLEQIVTGLTRAGFLKSQRGNSGGYRLARKPEEYTAGEILRAVEGDLSPVACLVGDHNDCERADSCFVLSFWTGLRKLIDDYVDGFTLQDFVNDVRSGNSAAV